MSRPFCGCAGSDWEGYLAAARAEIDRLLRERNGLQDMLAQARREAEDLRHRIEWDDLED
jgi:hypothetical protein